MSTILWPTTLPAFVTEESYSETAADLTIESSVDQGAPKVRRRFTAKYKPLQLSIMCTHEQAAAFETFYYETTSVVLPFDWVHPRTQQPVTMRFKKPVPSFATSGGDNVRITFSVWILPS